MKHLFYAILCVFFVNQQINSQILTTLPVNPNTNKIEYTGVIQVEGTTAELYTRALAWINSYFKNASDVTRVRDSNNGIIEGLHRMRIFNNLEDGTQLQAGLVQYEFKLQFRDNRFRYEIHSFVGRDISRAPIEKWLDTKDPSHSSKTPYHLEQIDKNIKEMIASMEKGMQKKVEVIEEW